MTSLLSERDAFAVIKHPGGSAGAVTITEELRPRVLQKQPFKVIGPIEMEVAETLHLSSAPLVYPRKPRNWTILLDTAFPEALLQDFDISLRISGSNVAAVKSAGIGVWTLIYGLIAPGSPSLIDWQDRPLQSAASVHELVDVGYAVIKLSEEPSWLEQTELAFNKLLDLRANWDSYGASRIEPAIVESARQLLRKVMRGDTPAPAVVPTSHGGVQLEWHTRGIDLEIELRTGDRIHVFFEDLRSGDQREFETSLSDLKRVEEAVRRLSHAA